MFKLLIISFLLSTLTVLHGREKSPSVSYGPVVKGETRLKLSSSDFDIRVENSSDFKIKTRLIDPSLEWVRVEKGLLLPRMKLEVLIDSEDPALTFFYQDRVMAPQKIKNTSYLQVFVSLFDPSPIEVYRKDKLVAQIEVSPKDGAAGTLVDYSCAPYGLKTKGTEDIFFSAGCNLIKSGPIGGETGLLEVHWTTPNLKPTSDKSSPYLTNLTLDHLSRIQLQDSRGEPHEIELSADVPRRVHRLKTAVGFGPHVMTSREGAKSSENDLTSPLLFYGRFTLTPETSFRFFNALFYAGSLFNKFGLYFAYDVGSAYDGRLKVTPLLGLQAISFKSEFSSRTHTRGIYPQGVEFVYNHAFGLKNYKLIFGAFLSPDSNDKYRNTWVRFGKKIFWEVNYLSWGRDERYSKQWGLSVGIPFMSFF